MRFANEAEAITYVFRSLRKLRGVDRGPDELSRDTTPTRRLLQATGLLSRACAAKAARRYARIRRRHRQQGQRLDHRDHGEAACSISVTPSA